MFFKQHTKCSLHAAKDVLENVAEKPDFTFDVRTEAAATLAGSARAAQVKTKKEEEGEGGSGGGMGSCMREPPKRRRENGIRSDRFVLRKNMQMDFPTQIFLQRRYRMR